MTCLIAANIKANNSLVAANGECICQIKAVPGFEWEQHKLTGLSNEERFMKAKLTGPMEAFGFILKEEAGLHTVFLLTKESRLRNIE